MVARWDFSIGQSAGLLFISMMMAIGTFGCSQKPHNVGLTLAQLSSGCHVADPLGHEVAFNDTVVNDVAFWTGDQLCQAALDASNQNYMQSVNAANYACAPVEAGVARLGGLTAAIAGAKHILEQNPGDQTAQNFLSVLTKCGSPELKQQFLAKAEPTLSIFSVGSFESNRETCPAYLVESDDGPQMKGFVLHGAGACRNTQLQSEFRPTANTTAERLGDMLDRVKYTGVIPDSEIWAGQTYATRAPHSASAVKQQGKVAVPIQTPRSAYVLQQGAPICPDLRGIYAIAEVTRHGDQFMIAEVSNKFDCSTLPERMVFGSDEIVLAERGPITVIRGGPFPNAVFTLRPLSKSEWVIGRAAKSWDREVPRSAARTGRA